jgi:short-subunit dehydrogenase
MAKLHLKRGVKSLRYANIELKPYRCKKILSACSSEPVPSSSFGIVQWGRYRCQERSDQDCYSLRNLLDRADDTALNYLVDCEEDGAMKIEKVALVTGALSGIGREIAQLLAKKGYRVFATSRKPPPGGAGGDIAVLPLDVRDDESVRVCVGKVLDVAGRIDALVNCAGCALMGALEEIGIDEAKSLFDTNFFGVMRMNRAILPIMRKQGGGRISNIGSASGFLPAPYSGIYAATKHALKCYSETLDHEVRNFGIRVSLIEPGFMRTDIAQHTQMTSQRINAYAAERDAVVAITLNCIANGEKPAIVARVVLNALTARAPRTRYLAGRGAWAANVMRCFLPAGVFDKGLRKQFGMT